MTASVQIFRNDINCLRAIAVTLVILFHYGVTGFSGGYVGVDVFFVISGYLMTKIILSKIEAGRFSLFGFYRARLLRILPPLLGVALAILIFGYVFVDAETYLRAAKEVVAAVTFTSNILYWREAGYFDPRSDVKVLLHTWSLSAEWQFYLLYPLALMLIARLQSWTGWLSPLLWLSFFASLVLCLVVSLSNAQAAFFLIPTRTWEMVAGGLVLLHFDRAGRRLPCPRMLAGIGLSLITMSALLFDRTTLWPSYHALLPVIGSCLFIAARASSRLTTNPIANIVGDWSYSIYLWHWPLLIFGHYVTGAQNVLLMMVLLVVAMICAVLAQRLVAATPVFFPPASKAWAALVCAVVLTAVSAGIMRSDGATWRHKDYLSHAALYRQAHRDWSFPLSCSGISRGQLRLCDIGKSDDRTLVIGDSHAEHLYPRFLDYARLGKSATFATMRGCPPISGMGVVSDHTCLPFPTLAFDLARSGHFNRVIISGMWSEYLGAAKGPAVCFVTAGGCVPDDRSQQTEAMMKTLLVAYAATLKRITDSGTQVVILGPVPSFPSDLPMELLRRDFLGRDKTDLTAGLSRRVYDRETVSAVRRLAQVAADSGSRLVDPASWLCNSDVCSTMDASGRPDFIDSNHYTSRAVRGPRFGFVDEAINILP